VLDLLLLPLAFPEGLLPPQALPLSAIVQPGQDPSSSSNLTAAAAAAAASAKAAGAGIIIDAGFSSCYVAPFHDGQLIQQGEDTKGRVKGCCAVLALQQLRAPLLTRLSRCRLLLPHQPPPAGVRRLNLGGKALTNLLKETVSYRSLDMRDEGLLMEQLKEQLCWVSQVWLCCACRGCCAVL
jgi:hypothetical protein